MMRRLTTAWQFLSAVRLPGRYREVSAAELAGSMAMFPVIGLIFGVILVSVWDQMLFVFSVPVCNVMVLFFLVLLSGGLHLDGLADTFDGIYGGSSKEKMLEIMKDERVGAIGAIALVFNLAIKLTAMNSIEGDALRGGIIVVPMVGRWSMVAAAFFSDYAKKETGLGKPFTDLVGIPVITVATVITVAAAFFFLQVKAVIPLLVVIIIVAVMLFYFKKKLGGITGDILGAGGEIVETVFLLILSAHFGY